MPVTVAAVAPDTALSKDTERGLLEWPWPSTVTSTKPSVASDSRTVCSPTSGRIANWPVEESNDSGAEPARDAAKSPGERPPSPVPAKAKNDSLTPDHDGPRATGDPTMFP